MSEQAQVGWQCIWKSWGHPQLRLCLHQRRAWPPAGCCVAEPRQPGRDLIAAKPVPGLICWAPSRRWSSALQPARCLARGWAWAGAWSPQHSRPVRLAASWCAPSTPDWAAVRLLAASEPRTSAAAATLHTAATAPFRRAVMADDVPALVRRLGSSSKADQVAAAGALQRLADAGGAASQAAIAGAGALPALVRLLSGDAWLAAGLALASLVAHSPDNAAALVEAGEHAAALCPLTCTARWT